MIELLNGLEIICKIVLVAMVWMTLIRINLYINKKQKGDKSNENNND